MLQVQYIACNNNAGFDLNFSINWIDENGNQQTTSWNSGTYPIDNSRTSPDLASIGVVNPITVVPYVDAILGKHEAGNVMVTYAANGQVATYEVKGTTLDYSVTLQGGN